MSFIATVRTQLDAILDAQVAATTYAIKAAYDHEPERLTKFPCATLRYNNVRSDFHDLAANLRVLEFVIRVYAKSADKSQVESDIVTAVQEIIAGVEADPTLDNNVLQTLCTEAPVDDESREQEVRFVDILVECQLRLNR